MVSANSLKDLLPAPLRAELEDLPAIAIAFSGGLDSRFLCHAALIVGCQVLALHVTGPHIPACESMFARAWAEKNGLIFQEIELDPLRVAAVRQNGRDRCYACKNAMFEAMEKFLAWHGDPSLILCDGGNVDDLKVFRPGLRAVREHGVRSPLARAGLGKAQLRQLAARVGLDNPGQKASPCLLTRFAYGLLPTRDLLARVEKTENEIRAILPEDVDFRMRLVPAPELHLEQDVAAPEDRLDAILRQNGFASAKIRTQANLSGFFDRRDDQLP